MCLAGLLIGLLLGTNKGIQIYDNMKGALTADANKGALTADANKGAQANAATQGTQANDGTQAGINTTPVATVQGKCNPGFFEANGKCIQCP